MNLISTQWSMLYMRPLGHLESDLKSFPNAIPIPKLIPPNLPHHVWDFSSSQTLHLLSLITDHSSIEYLDVISVVEKSISSFVASYRISIHASTGHMKNDFIGPF